MSETMLTPAELDASFGRYPERDIMYCKMLKLATKLHEQLASFESAELPEESGAVKRLRLCTLNETELDALKYIDKLRAHAARLAAERDELKRDIGGHVQIETTLATELAALAGEFEAIQQERTDKAGEAVARPTIKVRRRTPEYASYLKARFPWPNEPSHGGISFEWNGKRYSYQHTDFDDDGEFDVLLCAAIAAQGERK